MNQTATCPVNGIYFATHFGNWYVTAPVEEVCAYIRHLAKRGTNHLMLWMDASNCMNLESPEAQALLTRLRAYADTATSAGMKVGLVRVTNEAWRNSPVELRADPKLGRGAIMLSDVCATLPEARKLIQKTSAEIFGLFRHLDFICLWPYDSGGCGCPGCQPWGNNGFLTSGKLVTDEFRRRFPKGQVILSTWFVDPKEWAEIRRLIEAGQLDWIDAIMAEPILDSRLPDLLKGDVPRSLPLLGFPEISMEGMSPWGGCGANPRPEAIRKRWTEVGSHISGGFPYSEGMYEDVNKAVYAGLYRDRNRSIDDILREYVSIEFSPDVADAGVEMLRLMETTLDRTNLEVRNLDAADRVWQLAEAIQAKLKPEVTAHWRWQVLYLRAQVDFVLKKNKGQITDELRAVFAKIHALYHTDETCLLHWLLPPLPPQKTAIDPANIAAQKPVTVSSIHPLHPGSAAALVDNVVAPFDPENFWCSASGDATPVITFDLGEEKALAAVLLQFRGGTHYRYLPAWVSVDTSRDGKTYEPAVTQSRDVPVAGQIYKQWFYSYPVRKTARYVKVTLGASAEVEAPYAGCVQLAEIRIHGAGAGKI